MMRTKPFIAVLLCIAFLILTGGTLAADKPDKPDKEEEITLAASYDDIIKAIKESFNRSGGYIGKGGAATAVTAAPMPADEQAAGGWSSDYSRTNVQVEGIDEGDIVKTDGRFIYVLRENKELIILEARGAGTVKRGAVKLIDPVPDDQAFYTNEYATDLYVYGDTVAVVSTYYAYRVYYMEKDMAVTPKEIPEETAVSSAASAALAVAAPAPAKAAEPAPIAEPDRVILPYPPSRPVTKVTLYDVSNPSAPKRLTTLAQDGGLLSSRLLDGTLYVVSNHYIYGLDEDTPESFVPALYRDGERRLMAPGEIGILPIVPTTRYTVACAYDLDSGDLAASRSVLGGGETLYMNRDSLYVAGTRYEEVPSAPYTYKIYTVTDYASRTMTDIVRFDLTGGNLEIAASGSVEGSLYGQFALDAYEGNLRVVTTSYISSWTVYADEELGFTNYKWHESTTRNSLFVLDENLSLIGQVTDLAPGEQVYSVRFDGPVGYITTFRQVDPLFAVDLSDPTSPQVLSALKIPGFSQYLHVFGENRLFGLGMDADEDGRTLGMKLTMFDTTDKTNVTVLHELKLDSRYSPALYNHKAILISPAKKLIGFPVDSGYVFYGYSDAAGFHRLLYTDTAEWSYDSRGLYIGNYAYIVGSNALTVYNLDSFTFAGRLPF